MSNSKSILAILIITIVGTFPAQANKYIYTDLYKNLPFPMQKLEKPNFPENVVSVEECGGIGNGMILNTKAFENAINILSEKGGGTLLVPFGVWLTGPIELKSNINLHLSKGAIILFTSDLNAYPLVKAVFEGQNTYRCQSPISGKDLTNIAITGEGTINGNGQIWRPLKKIKVTEEYWNSVISTGGVLVNKDYWLPTSKIKKAEDLMKNKDFSFNSLSSSQLDSIKDYFRPVMINFISCKNVYLQGVLFENSPNWNIHPLLCENLLIDNITIKNPSYAQNGDGIDFESCKNVIMVNSTIDAGDDAICLKSGKDEEGRLRAKPTENVIVDNCKVFKGHGGFVVGSEMSGGVRNVLVSNCSFMGTNAGLRFKSGRGRGGIVENIYVRNISMFDIVFDSFVFDLYYGAKNETESAVDSTRQNLELKLPQFSSSTPVFRNIFIENVISRNANRAMYFNGLPEMNIMNVQIKNSKISSRLGAEIVESDGVIFDNVEIIPKEGAALILDDVKNFKMEGTIYPGYLKNPIEVKGKNSRNIKISENKIANLN
ncbi:MAG: glycoside hydrolase family 28 protein [Paludibacter sp.]|nr:glycoside hydrolase family 28 protein [Paludibacter sp.]